MGTYIEIPFDQTTLRAYETMPKGSGPFPALVAVQEWWGLNQNIVNIADRLTSDGYLVLAPDLYEGSVADDSAEAQRLNGLYAASAPAKCMAAYDALFARDDVRKIGCIGWCMGGRMALHLAVNQPALDAAVIFYGRPEQYFGQIADIECPVLGLFGEKDESIPVARVEQLRQELEAAGVPHEIVVYPGADHAFFNESHHTYHPEAAADAWERTLRFLSKYLA